MFERFTDRARRVVVLAQEEARLLNHNYIGTEHILLGLVRENEGVAARALAGLGVSLDTVRARVQEIIGSGGSAPAGHIPFTPRAKRVLELALREALRLGHNYIGTEHILLGLIAEGQGVAAQVLVKLGADLDRVREEVIRLLSGYPPLPAVTAHVKLVDTPAVVRARDQARRLAGAQPLRTHHVLAAMVEDENSLAARALAALGITRESLEAQLASLEVADSSDELPEEAGARRLSIEIVGDRVAVLLEDDALRDRLSKALPREGAVLRSTDAAAATFPGLWQDLSRHLADVVWRLEKEAAAHWRPPAWSGGWSVAAYAVSHGAGGMESHFDVAEGVDPEEVRAGLAAWLTANQPANEGSVSYLAVLVDTDERGERTYRLFTGSRENAPQTQPQFLVAHAILDLSRPSGAGD